MRGYITFLSEEIGVDEVKTVAIFQSDLKVGGIQKSLVNLLAMLPSEEFEIDVFLFDNVVFYDLSEIGDNVHFYFLKPYIYWNRFVYFGLIRLFHQKKLSDKIYDLAIDFNSYRNECAVGALSVSASKRVMWIHNDVSIKKKEEPKYRILTHFFKGKYRYFDEFVAVSAGIVEPFAHETGVDPSKIRVVPNFINANEIHRKVLTPIAFQVNPAEYNLVSMGRLCHQKGFDILLKEFSQVIDQRKDIHLYLIGDGPERERLLAQTANLNIESFVTFLGNQENPFPYLAKMDGFILDSRYEGQGMVLWEAKAVGLTLFLPRRLEKYNDGLSGCDNIVDSLIKAQKTERKLSSLTEYNQKALFGIQSLFK